MREHPSAPIFLHKPKPCLFCDETMELVSSNRIAHLACHLEEVALAIVPQQYEDLEFYSDTSRGSQLAEIDPVIIDDPKGQLKANGVEQSPTQLESGLGQSMLPERRTKGFKQNVSDLVGNFHVSSSSVTKQHFGVIKTSKKISNETAEGEQHQQSPNTLPPAAGASPSPRPGWRNPNIDHQIPQIHRGATSLVLDPDVFVQRRQSGGPSTGNVVPKMDDVTSPAVRSRHSRHDPGLQLDKGFSKTRVDPREAPWTGTDDGVGKHAESAPSNREPLRPIPQNEKSGPHLGSVPTRAQSKTRARVKAQKQHSHPSLTLLNYRDGIVMVLKAHHRMIRLNLSYPPLLLDVPKRRPGKFTGNKSRLILRLISLYKDRRIFCGAAGRDCRVESRVLKSEWIEDR